MQMERPFTEKRNTEKELSLGGKCIWFEHVKPEASFGIQLKVSNGSEFREVRLKISG